MRLAADATRRDLRHLPGARPPRAKRVGERGRADRLGLRGAGAGAPASRERAPIIKAGGRFVIVGKLTSPYVETNETEGEPTLDDPYDVYTRTITVSVKPIRVVLIGPTGEEIWSCKPGRFQPSPNPVPLGNQADWIQTYDFPYSARSERKSGSVEVRLTVSSAGSVNDCSVVISSGSTELDIAACTALRRRARFTPAADDDGEPIASHFDKTVRWNFAS